MLNHPGSAMGKGLLLSAWVRGGDSGVCSGQDTRYVSLADSQTLSDLGLVVAFAPRCQRQHAPHGPLVPQTGFSFADVTRHPPKKPTHVVQIVHTDEHTLPYIDYTYPHIRYMGQYSPWLGGRSAHAAARSRRHVPKTRPKAPHRRPGDNNPRFHGWSAQRTI